MAISPIFLFFFSGPDKTCSVRVQPCKIDLVTPGSRGDLEFCRGAEVLNLICFIFTINKRLCGIIYIALCDCQLPRNYIARGTHIMRYYIFWPSCWNLQWKYWWHCHIWQQIPASAKIVFKVLQHRTRFCWNIFGLKLKPKFSIHMQQSSSKKTSYEEKSCFSYFVHALANLHTH